MNRDQLATMLLTCIRDVQVLCGKTSPDLTLDLCPFNDLEAFDSLTAVETTILLSKRIGKDIRCGKQDVNIFVSEDGRRPLNLAEVLERLESLITDSNGK